MIWVRSMVDKLGDQRYVNLPDGQWRLLYEIGLLCGEANGPIDPSPAGIAWRLRRNAAEVESNLSGLRAAGLLEELDGKVCPVGWIEENAPYMHKLQYNRHRHREQRKGEDMLTLEQERKVGELERYDKELQGKVPDQERAQLVNARMAELGLSFDVLFDAIPTGRENGRVSQAPLDPNAPWRVWARGNAIVYQLPEEMQEASYLLFEIAGIEPYGSKKDWTSATRELVDACGGDRGVMIEAITLGQQMRQERHLTLKGPRSFVGFARDVRSRRVMEGRQANQDVSAGSQRKLEEIEL